METIVENGGWVEHLIRRTEGGKRVRFVIVLAFQTFQRGARKDKWLAREAVHGRLNALRGRRPKPAPILSWFLGFLGRRTSVRLCSTFPQGSSLSLEAPFS